MSFASTEYSCLRCERSFPWERLTTTRAGNLLCPECLASFDQEPIRKCPVDGSDMDKKRVLDKFLIDRCPKCEGIWFDKGELRVVQQAAKEAGTGDALANVAPFLSII